MADSATIELRGDNADLKKSLAQSQATFERFGSTVKRIGGVIAAAFAARAVIGFGRSALEAFGNQEQAVAKLNAVLKATGGVTGFTSEQLQEMASSLQNVTTFGDEVILNAQSIIATFKNIRGDEFRRATEAALDMATVLGQDLNSSAVQLGKALNDPIKGITALSRVGVQFTESQREMIAAMVEAGDVMGAQGVILKEIEGQMGGAARAAADTFTGHWQQMKNRFGDIMETIGEALVPVMEQMAKWLGAVATIAETTFVPAFKEVTATMTAVWASITDFMEPVLAGLVDGFVAAFTGIQVVIENFSTAARLSIYAFALAWVKQFEIMKHWLTTVIPDLLAWFGRNWVQIFTDLASATATIFENMWKNIEMFFENVFKWLSGEETNWQWTGLLEGFEATLEEMPRIAERHKGELEKALEGIVGDLGEEMATAFDKQFDENRRRVNEAIGGAFTRPDGPRASEAIRPGNVEAPSIEVKEVKAKELKADKLPELDLGDDSFRATFAGLEDLNRSIQAAAASRDSDDLDAETLKAIEEGAAETVAELERQTDFNKQLVARAEAREKAAEQQATSIVAAIEKIQFGWG